MLFYIILVAMAPFSLSKTFDAEEVMETLQVYMLRNSLLTCRFNYFTRVVQLVTDDSSRNDCQ